MTKSLHLICAVLAFTAIQNVATQDNCLVDNILEQEDFDMDRYLGKWYQIKIIPDTWIPDIEDAWTDVVSNITRYEGRAGFAEYYAREPSTGECFSGTSKFWLTDIPGRHRYKLTDANGTQIHGENRIILTDYDNYMLIWGCQEVQNGYCVDGKEDSWVWSRTPTLSPELMALVNLKITEVCLDLDDYIFTEQSDECP